MTTPPPSLRDIQTRHEHTEQCFDQKYVHHDYEQAHLDRAALLRMVERVREEAQNVKDGMTYNHHVLTAMDRILAALTEGRE